MMHSVYCTDIYNNSFKVIYIEKDKFTGVIFHFLRVKSNIKKSYYSVIQ